MIGTLKEMKFQAYLFHFSFKNKYLNRHDMLEYAEVKKSHENHFKIYICIYFIRFITLSII